MYTNSTSNGRRTAYNPVRDKIANVIADYAVVTSPNRAKTARRFGQRQPKRSANDRPTTRATVVTSSVGAVYQQQ